MSGNLAAVANALGHGFASHIFMWFAFDRLPRLPSKSVLLCHTYYISHSSLQSQIQRRVSCCLVIWITGIIGCGVFCVGLFRLKYLVNMILGVCFLCELSRERVICHVPNCDVLHERNDFSCKCLNSIRDDNYNVLFLRNGFCDFAQFALFLDFGSHF